MYLKVESVSAVEIASSSSSSSNTSSSSSRHNSLSSSSSLSSGIRPLGVSKIHVPLQHRLGGGAAAAAAVAAAASAATGAAACTPDEIYCYTQSNSNINRTTSLHYNTICYPAAAPYYHPMYANQTTAAIAPATAALNRGFCRLPSQQHHHHQYDSATANSSHNNIMGIHHNDANAFASTVDVQHGPGRPDRLEQVMSLHPQYLKIFNKSQSFIMRGDGPLPFHYRHYIAIMAAGRHQCSYLIQQQMSEFLSVGGDERWLNGLHSIPAKLRDLYEINKILAHRPWLITKQHIEKLTKGSDSWSLGELVHALVILSSYHAISSFVFGVGIGDGEDEPPCSSKSTTAITITTPTAATPSGNSSSGQSTPTSTSGSPPQLTNGGSGGSPLVSATREIVTTSATAAAIGAGSNQGSRSNSGRGSPDEPRSAAGSRRGTGDFGMMQDHELTAGGLDALMMRMKNLDQHRQEYSAEEQTKRYEHVESQSAELGVVGSSTTVDGFSSTRPKPEISQFIDDPDFTYQDFARRGSVNLIPTFRVQDYSWDDHAFSLINRLYNDVGNLLDDKFRLMYQLTYNFMGSKKDVDTSRFRTAIWNYIQCMFGIRHDDYDYGEVNQVLERSLKAYIKTAVCFPERLTRADYNNVLKELHHSEKIHVNLMLLEARIQAELLYALRAVMRYMI